MKKEHTFLKRCLSILLSVSMIVGLIVVTEPEKAADVQAAESTNLITNGGFDTTDGWTNNSDSSNPVDVQEQQNVALTLPNYVAYQDFETTSEYAGKWRNQSPSTGTLEYTSDLDDANNQVLKYTSTGNTTFDFHNGDVQIFEQGKTYVLSFKYKTDVSFHAYHAGIDSGWNTYEAWVDTSTSWKTMTCEITPSESLGSFQIGFQPQGTGTIYIDDFTISCGETEKVTEKTVTVFESGFDSTDELTKVQSNPGSFGIDTTEKKSGDGSLKLAYTGAWAQGGLGNFELKSGITYTISYDWKITGYSQVDSTQNAYSRLVKANDVWAGLVLSPFQTSETDWTTVTYTYTPSENITAAIYMEVGGGTGTIYLDNLSVSYTTIEKEYVYTEGIGTCLGAEPDNVLVMEDMTEVTYPTTITNGTTYMYSFETKNDATGSDFTFGFGAGENAIWSGTSGTQAATDWTTVSGMFTATSDASTIKFTRTGEGKVYIDDVSLIEVEIKENSIANGGFNSTTDWTNNSDSSNPVAVQEQQNVAVTLPNYVAYQDFETTSEYAGKWRNQSPSTGTLEYTSDLDDANNQVLKYTSTGNTTFDFHNGDVQIFEQGKTYVLSFKYKTDVSFHAYHAGIDSGWNTYEAWVDTSTSWKTMTCEITPSESLGSFQIGFQPQGTGTIYIDDFTISCGETEKVTEKTVTVFESGFDSTDELTKVQSNPGSFGIDTTEKKSGDGSLKLAYTGAWAQGGLGNFELKSGITYTISYDWKITGYSQVDSTQNAYSRLVKANDVWAGLVLSPFQTSETDWTTVTYTYTPSENITAAIYMEVGGGTGTIYLDNLSVSYTTIEKEYVYTEGIGTCLGAEPDNVLVMEDMTEVTYPTTITNGTTYMYSFETKNDATGSDFTFGFGAGENAIWSGTSGTQAATDWTTVSGMFTATSDASTIKFTRTGEGKVYIDDVSVKEISTDITPEIVVEDNTPNANNMPSGKENMISGGDFTTDQSATFAVQNAEFTNGYVKISKPSGEERAFLRTPALTFVKDHSYTISYYVNITEATGLTLDMLYESSSNTSGFDSSEAWGKNFMLAQYTGGTDVSYRYNDVTTTPASITTTTDDWAKIEFTWTAEQNDTAYIYLMAFYGQATIYADDLVVYDNTVKQTVEITPSKAYPDTDNSWYIGIDDISKATSSYYKMTMKVDGKDATVPVGIYDGKFVIWHNFFPAIDGTKIPSESFVIPKDTILYPIDPDNTGWTTEIDANRLITTQELAVYAIGSGWGTYSEEHDTSATPIYYCIDNNMSYMVTSSAGAYEITKDGVEVTATELTEVGTYDITRIEQDTKFVQKVVLYKSGDAHADATNTITSKDLVAVKKAALAENTNTLGEQFAADVNRSGSVDAFDAKVMRRALVSDDAVTYLSKVKGNTSLNGEMPIIGFDGPDTKFLNGKNADTIYSMIKELGFNTVLLNRDEIGTNYAWSSSQLSVAEKYGLKLYLNDGYINDESNVDGIGSNLGDSAKTKLSNITSKYEGYSSFGGYFIEDEPMYNAVYNNKKPIDNFDVPLTSLKGYTNIHSYLNLAPYIAGQINKQLGGSSSAPMTYQNYKKYIDASSTAGVEALSYDMYLRGNGITTGAWFWENTSYKIHTEDFWTNLDWMSKIAKADSNKNPFYAFVQVGNDFSDENKNATATANLTTIQEMYFEANAALAMGAKGINYYSLVQPQEYVTSEDNSTDYTRSGLINYLGEANNGGSHGANYQYYNAAKKINAYIKAVDEVLMNATSEAVITTNSTVAGYLENEVSSYGSIASINNTEVLVGCFDYYGQEAFMVVNITPDVGNSGSAQNVTLTFDGAQSGQYIDMDDTAWQTMTASSTLALTIPAGEAVVIVLD